MTIVLDSGALTALAGDRAKLDALRRRGVWPPLVPTVVLTESLTSDHRRDFHVNRLLRACEVRIVDELLARRAASLRFAVGRQHVPSAVDAIVVALADDTRGATVLTSDTRDLRALSRHTANDVPVERA